jgi:hypothetical protein
LSLCGILTRASPVPSSNSSTEGEMDKRQSLGYKNIVYFTNWCVSKLVTSDCGSH